MAVKILKRSFFQRMLGIPATGMPLKPGCWVFSGKEITIDLDKAPELAAPGGALRLEGAGLPVRVLVVRGEGDAFHAFRNRCTHLGRRRLDPVPGTATVQCCSVNTSTFTLEGKSIHGPGKNPLTVYPVEKKGNSLVVKIG
jgi:nitrite reductase/ring-hydroxylating ferredoxin subunit